MDIGKRIKELRLAKGMTLEELGNKVGVGKSTVRKWETGIIENMRRDKIIKVANALDCTVSYLLGMENEEGKTVYSSIEDTDGHIISFRDETLDAFSTNIKEKKVGEPYYLNDDAREMAQFMFENPEYKVLFDASRKISKEDIETVKTIMDKFRRHDAD